jgi:hypothetical protein
VSLETGLNPRVVISAILNPGEGGCEIEKGRNPREDISKI